MQSFILPGSGYKQETSDSSGFSADGTLISASAVPHRGEYDIADDDDGNWERIIIFFKVHAKNERQSELGTPVAATGYVCHSQ